MSQNTHNQQSEFCVDSDAIQWAIEFLITHSDGDIFPHVPEISALAENPSELIAALSSRPLRELTPQPCRRFDVPKEDFSIRRGTQLHPQDSIVLTALIYQFGNEIEKRRLPDDTVFSYRFQPTKDQGLYLRGRLWNKFWQTAADSSEAFNHVIYCDIADFYNQISHHTVQNQLIDATLPNQVHKWIDNLLQSTTAGVSRGVPVGPHAAHLLAEAAMIPIDNSLQAVGIPFLRYVDDIIIFCISLEQTNEYLRTLRSILQNQAALTLQDGKTEIFQTSEFAEHCEAMIEDRPINEEEAELLQVIDSYSNGDPYTPITYDEIKPEDWRKFSQEVVSDIVEEYIEKETVDYIRLRWFFRRLAQVGHPGALDVVIENINDLEPCLPSVCTYISSIQAIPEHQWTEIGAKLLNILEKNPILNTEFARLSILSLFSKNQHIDHFNKLANKFDAMDSHSRREIILAAHINSNPHWLRQHKENFQSMDPWQKMAYVYCISRWASDEKTYFLNRHNFVNEFEKNLKKWSRSWRP